MEAKRISVKEAMFNAGYEEMDEDVLGDSVMPACCSEGCEVEPDGECEHGFPSVLLAMGLI